MTDTEFGWNDTFLIGITELDHEHMMLFDDINRLHNELTSLNDKIAIENCLGEIFARMQAHFALEEQVMQDHDYKFYAEHKHQHDELLDHYTELMMRYLNHADTTSSQALESVLEHWVVEHIISSDRKMSLMIQDS